MHRVGIIGGSGYSGIELTRLIAGHPSLELAWVTSDRWLGETVEARLGLRGPAGALRYSDLETALVGAGDLQAVLLATPAEASTAIVPRLSRQSLRVIDLSGAFRLARPELYPSHYGFEHPAPQLLTEAAYGLTDWFGNRAREARLVANPGCYATAAVLALAPLLRDDLIEPDSLIIDAASGATGAGRKASEELSFSEVADDMRAYKIFRHQHTPEIAEALAAIGGRPVDLTFTPHLLAIRRGILCTAHARLRPEISGSAPQQSLLKAYAGSAFVRVRPSPEAVSLRATCFTNRCDVSAAVDEKGRVVVISALDNLLKGAAGQAIENLNLMLGFPQTAGLEGLHGAMG
jgi:N-acetyl-gamma-glutamyl-phosphate reductase